MRSSSFNYYSLPRHSTHPAMPFDRPWSAEGAGGSQTQATSHLCQLFYFSLLRRRRRCRGAILVLLTAAILVLITTAILLLDSDDRLVAGESLDAHRSTNQTCVHPHLQLWHPEMKSYFKPPPPLRCSSSEPNWVFTANGTFQISPSAVSKHGPITCIYTPIRRGRDDFEVQRGTPIKTIKSGDALTSDVFEAKCVATDGAVQSIVLSGVAGSEAVRRREMAAPLPSGALGLDVLMFGFDSVSRMTWMRNLPRSYAYFTDILGGVVLEGYNVVGDGTPQALLPILTGRTEWELPEARRGFKTATVVDSHPWIWNDLKELGYATQWGEDSASFGTFTYRMLGFKEQPVDHYLRTFYLEAERHYAKYERFCLGSVARHANMMNWMKEFVDVYAAQRKFSFVFHAEYTHGGYSELQLADADLLLFLQHLQQRGHLDHAILLLMSDHGARFQELRRTEQGKYEERMPFFGVRLPPKFVRANPAAARNLAINARRLTTPFDIYATLRDVVRYEAAPGDAGIAENMGSADLAAQPQTQNNPKAEVEENSAKVVVEQDLADGDEGAEIEGPFEDAAPEATERQAVAEGVRVGSVESHKGLDHSSLPAPGNSDTEKKTEIAKDLKNKDDPLVRVRKSAARDKGSAQSVAPSAEVTALPRGISLFKEIPMRRSCADASIEAHWCACLSWKGVPLDDPSVRQAALKVVETINAATATERALCAPLTLQTVTKAVHYAANDQVLHFLRSADTHGRVPDLSDAMKASEALIQVTLVTSPGGGVYEATVRHDLRGGGMSVESEGAISRVSRYGAQPHCVAQRLPHLRAFCYCRVQLEGAGGVEGEGRKQGGRGREGEKMGNEPIVL